MATETVTDHIELARDFLAKSKVYLRDGDLRQASEKGWGAAAHMAKAVAATNGREYEHHDQFTNVVVVAGQKYRQPSLLQMSDAAQALHASFYKRRQSINVDATKKRIESVEHMIGVLRPFIDRMAEGNVAAIAFTSQPQVVNLVAIAAEAGLEGALRGAMNSEGLVVGSVGPVSSRRLREYDFGVDVEPDHPHMGNLVIALAEHFQGELVR